MRILKLIPYAGSGLSPAPAAIEKGLPPMGDVTDIEALIDAIPKPALVIDGSDRIRAANTSADDAMGHKLGGLHFVSVFRNPHVLKTIEDVRRDGQARRVNFSRLKRGAEHVFELHCSAVEGTRPRQLFLMLEDISEREHASQMRRDFVANVSHELRTPLTAILGFIETLLGPAKDDAPARKHFLEIMAREAGRMERLVSDLLSLSRVEAEERRAPSEPVDLSALGRSVARILAPKAKARSVEIKLDMEEALVVTGDEDQLRQVLSNLIENAIKYGAQGGNVTLTGRRLAQEGKAERVILSVADEGEGIDPVHIPRLTERFYRVDNHRSRAQGGTGLGLAIVKHIVARHKGRLKIESERGKGSVFSLILPTHNSTQGTVL